MRSSPTRIDAASTPWSGTVCRCSSRPPKRRSYVSTASSRSSTATPRWWIPRACIRRRCYRPIGCGAQTAARAASQSRRRRGDEPEHAEQRAGGHHDEGGPKADRRAEGAPEQSADRPDAVVHRAEGGELTRAEAVGGDADDQRADVDVEDHHPERDRNSPATTMAITAGSGPTPAGRGGSGAGKSTEPRTIAGPMPITRPTAGPTAAPTSPPIAPAPSATPIVAGAEAELVGHEEEDDGGEAEVEEVDRRRAAEPGAQQRMAPDEAEALGQARADALARRRLERRLVDPDPADEERRADERGRVDEDRHRRGQNLHEDAGERRPEEVRQRPRGAQLGVRLDEVLALGTTPRKKALTPRGRGRSARREERDRQEVQRS